jgi:hypothetical protein
MDRCVNNKATKRLQALGYDCIRWQGDPRSKDKEIAIQAAVLERVMVSADWDFVDLHRRLTVYLGHHVHLIGRKKDQPALLETRIAELDATISARGPGLYFLEANEHIVSEKGGTRRPQPQKAKTRRQKRGR